MDSDYDRYEVDAPRPPRIWLRLLVFFIVAFVAGAIAMGWVLTHWGAAQRYLHKAEPLVAIPATLPRIAHAPPPSVAATSPAVEQRLDAIEGKIGDIDQRTSAAVGDADRAEGLLVAFAARRALDRGVDLGYIEGLLRERFGTDQPEAVATIISAAHQPVTLEELQTRLDTAAPSLAGTGPQASWWSAFRRELGGLIIIRRADSPSPAPADRLTRAQRALEVGHVEVALAEVSRLPGRSIAADWIAEARRYVSSRAALDRIETAALLDPRTSTATTAPATTGAWSGD